MSALLWEDVPLDNHEEDPLSSPDRSSEGEPTTSGMPAVAVVGPPRLRDYEIGATSSKPSST